MPQQESSFDDSPDGRQLDFHDRQLKLELLEKFNNEGAVLTGPMLLNGWK